MVIQYNLCIKCKGKGLCGMPCRIYSKIGKFLPKTKLHFSGNSPPEIFVGRNFYPNISAGILAPQEEIEDAQELTMPESWHAKNLSIAQILRNRNQLIYGKFKTQIKQNKIQKNKFTAVMQEISMAYKSVSTEFFLSKPPKQDFEIDTSHAVIGNPAPVHDLRLQENPKIKQKVDYLVNDTDVKANTAIKELYFASTEISNIIKILSAGLLGKQINRRLVPTRWAITATDDSISKELLKKIKFYPELNEILLFHGYYIGNHYEILLIPDKFSFEVIEAFLPRSAWNQFSDKPLVNQDYEGFQNRKYYAENVTGAYYTARLALCEYLEKIKKQCSCLFMREERQEYYAPCGVGILRELARSAFQSPPEKFNTIQEALKQAQTRLKLPISTFENKSWLLKETGKQLRLNKFIR